jgi:hypothetical protein
MRLGRYFSHVALSTVTICILTVNLSFGFSFGGDEIGKCGLDLNSGYDINTVTTVTGKVVSLPQALDKSGVIFAIKSASDTIYLYVGSGTYWDKNGTAIRLNDEITVKGSKTVGKDGKTYLLARILSNRTTNSQVLLRNEKGDPGWHGADVTSGNQGGDMMRNGGNMMRSGSGGMMRSGGGMMRH